MGDSNYLQTGERACLAHFALQKNPFEKCHLSDTVEPELEFFRA